jgi:hypothetical protein
VSARQDTGIVASLYAHADDAESNLFHLQFPPIPAHGGEDISFIIPGTWQDFHTGPLFYLQLFLHFIQLIVEKSVGFCYDGV